MKWIKINTVTQRNEESTIELYKIFTRAWTVIELNDEMKMHPTFWSIREAKKYAEKLKGE